MGIKSKKVYNTKEEPIDTYTKVVDVQYTPRHGMAGTDVPKFMKKIEYEVYKEKGGELLYRGASVTECEDDLDRIYSEAYNNLKQLDSFVEPTDQ